MSLQTAIELNNHSVSLLSSKLSLEAIETSLSAIQQFQVHLRAIVSEEDSQNTIHHHQRTIDLCMSTGGLDEVDSEDTCTCHWFIYQNGIMLPSNISDTAAIKSVLIFNAALAHQLSARSCCDERDVSERFLLRARELYQLAFRGQCNHCDPAFRVAMVNNLGVIYEHIGDHDHRQASENLFRYLESFAMYFLSSGRCHEMQKVNGFWANIHPNLRPAPVA